MDLRYLLDRYHSPESAPALIGQARPLTISGPTGAGKNSTVGEVVASGGYEPVISHTTRPQRMNNGRLEEEGIDYHFVGRDFMRSLLFARKMVEAHIVHGEDAYGTSLAELERIIALGKRAIMDVDIKGADDYNALSPAVRSVFLLTPSITEQRSRLRERFGNDADALTSWEKRKVRSITEIESALEREYFYFVVNRNLGATALEVRKIADIAERGDYDDTAAREQGMIQLEELRKS